MEAAPPAKVLAGKTVSGSISARINVDGRSYLNFFGAGYLALGGIPEVREAVYRALQQGVPFARQLPAAHGAVDPIFDAVEIAGAKACGTETSVYFASGYLIGAVALASFDPPFDWVLMDALAHYSLRFAVNGAGLPTVTFAHCDVGSLRDALKQHLKPGQRPLVVTDGVFPTTGRLPPLDEYAAALAAHDGRFLIDDSHAFGVVGKHGRGAADHFGVEHLAISGATLSKALCAHGAIMGCSTSTAKRVRGLPPISAACSGSPLSAAAATAGLDYVERHPELRDNLRASADYLRRRVRDLGLTVIDSPAPIVAFQCGSAAAMQALQRRAFDRGVYLHYSTYIGAGQHGVIRCAVFRDHSREDIDTLIDVLR